MLLRLAAIGATSFLDSFATSTFSTVVKPRSKPNSYESVEMILPMRAEHFGGVTLIVLVAASDSVTLILKFPGCQ